MKHLRQTCLIVLIMMEFCLTLPLWSQVSGLSYTISPLVERSWWNERSGLADSYLVGAQFGFGFGEFVELRATYLQSLDLMTDINNFGLGLSDDLLLAYKPKEVKFQRVGGEMKLNLSRGAMLPYLSLGTGVQTLQLDTFARNQQIYLNAGLGIKFTAADRYTLGLQAIRSGYRYNAPRFLLDQQDRQDLGLILEDFQTEELQNWSLRATLALYLGGRKPGSLTDVDEAYLRAFSGGFSGVSVPIEPTVMKLRFHDDLDYRDTWMFGGSAGVNFGPLIGVRGFYWRALREGSQTSFDDLAMYGGEARFKLNEGKGFTPWLTVGGGQIKVGEEYLGRDSVVAESKAFAMGGLGLDLPFSQYVKATGFVRSILTAGTDIGDLAQPLDVKSSWSYGVSLNFVLGRKAQKIDVVKQSAFDEYILASNEENQVASGKLKREYEDRIAVLELELQEAIKNKDVEAYKEISEEKSTAEKVVQELEEDVVNDIPVISKNSTSEVPGLPEQMMPRSPASEIRMTPAEFQLLIRDLIDALKKNSELNSSSSQTGSVEDQIQKAMDDRDLTSKVEGMSIVLENAREMQNSLRDDQAELKNLYAKVSRDLDDLLREYHNGQAEIDQKLKFQDLHIEDILDRQLAIELGLTNSNQPVVLESSRDSEMQQQLEMTNIRMEDLRKTVISALEEVKTHLDELQTPEPLDGIQKIVADDQMTQRVEEYEESPKTFSNRDQVQSDRTYRGVGFFDQVKYTGMSGFAGFNVGGNATFNVGYRLHYSLGDSSKFEFIPESFFGFGSPSSFGITGNLTYSLDFLSNVENVKPYLGFGLGFMKVGDAQNEDRLKGAINFIAGTYVNVWAGDLYVDFTARNLFKYNQLIVGYRFPF